jgi:hypothetical protein
MIVLETDDCDDIEDDRAKLSVVVSKFADDISGNVVKGDEESIVLRKYSKSSDD